MNCEALNRSLSTWRRKIKALITCGPTWVALDDVRVLSNVSTGELGHLLAQKLKTAGARVTLIEGPVTHRLENKLVRVIKYQFFDELAEILKSELKKKI